MISFGRFMSRDITRKNLNKILIKISISLPKRGVIKIWYLNTYQEIGHVIPTKNRNWIKKSNIRISEWRKKGKKCIKIFSSF
jgi:hypothetical protein